jgi:protein TonB
MRLDPYARNPAKLSKTGNIFALVMALHIALLWLAQAVWTSESDTALRSSEPLLVTAQLVQDFQVRKPAELAKPDLTKPKLTKPELLRPELLRQQTQQPPPSPQPLPLLTSQPAIVASSVPSALPAIGSTPTTTAASVVALPPMSAAPTHSSAVPFAASLVAAAPKPQSVTAPAAARMESCAKPRYPAASARLQEEGIVSLRFLIGENGHVLSGSIEKSSGYKRLDDAALAALSLCTFKPATVDGKPKQEWSALRYRWELNQ